MDRASIENALADCLPEATRVLREIDQAWSHGRYAETKPHISELTRPIADLLQAQPEFARTDQMMIDFGGLRMPFAPSHFATRFVRFACERGPGVALDWVAKVLD